MHGGGTTRDLQGGDFLSFISTPQIDFGAPCALRTSDQILFCPISIPDKVPIIIQKEKSKRNMKTRKYWCNKMGACPPPPRLKSATAINNKKVLLRERKRHTARQVAALSPNLLMGGGSHQVLMGEYPHPVLMRVYPIQSQWGEGYLIQSQWGYYHPVLMGVLPPS